MILGLPADTWLLILAATVPGMVLVSWTYAVHRRRPEAGDEKESAGPLDG